MNKRITKGLRRDIAIIGMSCRFPGAKNLAEFWQNLRDGVESISFFPPGELTASGVDSSALNNPSYVNAGSVLEDIEMFDASFFGFNAREAESMDPQERIFLECAWHALEDAGYDPERCDGSIGVYAGCALSSYLYELYRNPDFVSLVGHLQILIGNDKDYLTTHVSYKLNLKGPSYSVQTTCSTSLVAVCLACESLLSHRCDMALAGGVCIRVPQKAGYYYEPGGIFSPDGHCRVFDARAQGVVFGNGVGIVVMKRLADALVDGDSIHAVIRGAAVNNDGSLKTSYAAPSLDGQAEVIALAQARAGIKPGTITYIEAHGTGTPLGDPVEIAALTRAFRAGTKRKNFCAIGSVKSNVGHLDHAAGVAGLIKTVLSLKHKLLPPSLHFETPNPEIDFANSPFYVNTRLSEWKTNKLPRRAGTSAFGIGGTNAHVVLEEAPVPEDFASSRLHYLLILSARSSSALDTATTSLVQHLKQNPDLNPADLAYTYQIGRRAFSHRRALVYHDLADLVSALEASDSGRVLRTTQVPRQRSIAFMFSGQGTQYVNMGLDLYRVEPTFHDQVDFCSELLKRDLGFDLRGVLYPPAEQDEDATQKLRQTAITQPAMFVIEYSLAKLWMEWGVHPQAMIGHSIGEYVAACVAGVFSLEDALALVAERGKLMQQLPGGGMLAVPLPEPLVTPILDGNLSLAAINEPSLCVVSGPTDAIEQLEGRLAKQGLDCRRLHTSHAFHSPMMEPIQAAFTEKVSKVALKPPQLPYVSNVTGTWITASEATNPKYWANHLRLPVRFVEGLQVLLKEPDQLLVEVGPGQTLSTFARRHPAKTPGHIIVSSLRHPQERQTDSEFLLDTLGRVWLSGAVIDWSGFHAHERRHRIHLPTYAFERQRYWVSPPGTPVDGASQVSLLKKPDIAEWFYVPSWKYTVAPECSNRGDLEKQKSHWLVFEDAGGLGSQVRKRLAQDGQDVTTVREGEHFAKTGSNGYAINPRQPGDYHSLFNELHALGRLPDKIVHFWSITPNAETPSTTRFFDRCQDLGFYSLLYIAQALIKQNITDPIQIGIVSNHTHLVTGEEEICPGKATVLGACKSIPQEYPNISCCHVDVIDSTPGRQEDGQLVDQLIAEFTSDSVDTVVAYRGGQRWAQVFEPIQLDESTGIIPLLREGGVYLITGGLGNIGLALAEDLAATVQAKLALVRRSAFPAREDWTEWLLAHGEDDSVSRKIRRLQEIESLGSEVMVFSAEVADEEKMRSVVDQIYLQFGALHGVIHGAGSLAANSFFAIDQADRDLCERQFQSKVRGLMVLERVLRGEYLDFWLLLSSVASVLAGLGYVAYSAANIFMDAFACTQGQTTGVPWISVNWDTWDFRENPEATAEPSPADLTMFPEEGVEAFRRILSSASLPQVVVSTGDLQARIDQWINLKSLRERRQEKEEQSARLHVRPELSNPFVAPRNKLEQTIAETWQDTLGVAQVGVQDNFFTDLNGSSLLATQLVARLRSRFQVEFPLRRFFEAPTVANLAAAIEAMERERNVELGKRSMEQILKE